MRNRIGALSLMAAAALLLAACGGDDSKAEKKTRDGSSGTAVAAPATTAPSTSSGGGVAGVSSAATASSGASARNALALDCGKELKSFRFDGKLALQGGSSSNANDPSALLGSLLQDVKFSGAYVEPDRTQMKLDLGGKDSPLAGQAFELIQIGPDSYMKLGNTGWQRQETPGSSPVEDLNPLALCKQLRETLPAAAQNRKEKVNGTDAVRYDYDRKSLERLPGLLGGAGMSSSDLPENVKLSLWVAEKERFPVKMTLAASGQQSGERFSVDFEFNVSDLNSSNVKIEAPR